MKKKNQVLRSMTSGQKEICSAYFADYMLNPTNSEMGQVDPERKKSLDCIKSEIENNGFTLTSSEAEAVCAIIYEEDEKEKEISLSN